MRFAGLPDVRSNRLKLKASRWHQALIVREYGSRSRRPRLETLEGRLLLAGVVAEYPIPSPSASPLAITTGPDGALWFTENSSNNIGRITTGGAITEFPIPTADSFPAGITAGPDGALWFTELNADKIGRITTSGVVTEFAIPTVAGMPNSITAGPDGALWFTEDSFNRIGRITTDGVATDFPTTTPNLIPGGITAGSDGNLWYTKEGGLGQPSFIGRITTSGVDTEFPIPTNGSNPYGITSGPDGDIWFTETGAGKIGQLSPSITTTIQLTAQPNPVLVGQPLTFTAVVTPTQVGVNPVGSVNFSIDGGAATTVPLNDLDGKFQASLTIATLPVGAHTVTASYGQAIGFDPNSATQSVSVIAPPTVTAVQRFGYHADPTIIALSFSTGLDLARAQDVRNYRIVGPGGQVIKIDSALYSSISNMVTLSLHNRLNLHLIYQLTINGSSPSGITDTFGNLLDGAGNGQPGSNFVTNIKAANLVLGTQVPGGPARLAYLRGVLSEIEASQSKRLARLQHSSKTPKTTHRKPVTVSSSSPKPIQIQGRHEKAASKRSVVRK
jgi:streptogramin lyase